MGKNRILVVDDDDMICRVIERNLAENYDVFLAESAEMAINMYEETKPDFILSDLSMPKMDGFEMMEALRERYEVDIPVMFMTGYDSDDVEEKSLTVGAADYIRKPFKPDVLKRRIDNIMSNRDRISGLMKAADNDPMTGLLNKAASTRKIEETVRSGQGILLMIDLDSFKLVNDIYGHEKGDQILIRFAELLKSTMRSTDIIGRVGGDEFIVFCNSIRDENVIQEKTEYLNERLIAAARECLAEDMNIPLGCSVGGSICPDQGNDYVTLFKKADHALYHVKSNGKHGCEIFKQENAQEAGPQYESFRDIRKILGEREGQRGAYVLSLDSFKIIYRFFIRFKKNYAYDIQLVVFSFEKENDSVTEYVEKFMEVAASCLRMSDVLTNYGDDKVIALLLKNIPNDFHIPLDRVEAKWNTLPEAMEVKITHRSENL